MRAARGLRFEGVKVYVAAVDGQPTDTFEPLRATLPFPPGTRYDLMVDLPDEEGAKASVIALIGSGLTLASVTTKGDKLSQKRPPIGPIGENKKLPAEVKLQNAMRRDVVITGAPSSRRRPATRRDKAAPEPVYTGDPKKVWAINGISGATGQAPIFTVKRGQVVVLALRNDTAFPQALHLHGHCFRLLHPLDDGWEPYWLDTFQLLEGRTARIAFLADNPGRWLISATVLERFDTGLWTSFESRKPGEHGGHQFGQVLRDEARPVAQAGIAMEPHGGAGGFERRHSLRQQPAIRPPRTSPEPAVPR